MFRQATGSRDSQKDEVNQPLIHCLLELPSQT